MTGSGTQVHQQAAAPDGRIDQARRLLLEHDPGEPGHERGLDLLHGLADAPADASAATAQWLLGAYHLMTGTTADAFGQARHWLERAAAAGVAPALDRLADLHLHGVAVPPDRARAVALQQQLAERGFASNAWQLGYLLDQEPGLVGDLTAASAFARACALGHPPAFYSLGLRFARGHGVAPDPALARALLLRAGQARFPDALAAAEALAPAAVAGAATDAWMAKIRRCHQQAEPLLRALALTDGPAPRAMAAAVPELERLFSELDHPALVLGRDARLQVIGHGPAAIVPAAGWNWLSQHPRLAVCHGFASREERAHLMHKVTPWLADTGRFQGQASANDDAEREKFNGQGSPLGPINADPVMRTLERRIAGLTGWRAQALEPCSIIRYRPGQEYRAHVDYFDDEQIARNESLRGDYSGQRVATFLVYLRAPEAGGATTYPRAGLRVEGEDGMGVIHYNVDPAGRPDPLTLHCGEPVLKGEKWLWRCTLRERDLQTTVGTTQ